MPTNLDDRWPFGRSAALILSFGACCLALLCLPSMLTGQLSRTLPTLSPGYLVTGFYIWRALRSTPKLTRAFNLYRIGWAISALVQGGWLAWFIIDVVQRPSFRELANPMNFLAYSWWGMSSIISVAAILFEKLDNRRSTLREFD